MSNAAVDHSSRDHARVSPSSMKHFEICGFWKNKNQTNAAADSGTLLHEALETEDFSKLEEHDRGLAQMCLEYANGVKAGMKNPTIIKETRLQILESFGTVDLLMLEGSEGHLLDWKTGYLRVDEAESNVQMQAYCLGAWAKFPELDKITVHIPMPRLGSISVAVYTRTGDYERVKNRISAILEKANNPVEYSAASLETCDYCANKANCPLWHNTSLAIAQKAGLELPEFTGTLTISSPGQMNQMLKYIPILDGMCKSLKEEALRLHLEEGWEYDDFRLTTKSTDRSVTSALAAWEALKEHMTPEEFIGAVSRVSVPDLEEVFSSKAPRGKKAAEAARLENILRDQGCLKDQGEIRYLKAIKNKKQLKNSK